MTFLQQYRVLNEVLMKEKCCSGKTKGWISKQILDTLRFDQTDRDTVNAILESLMCRHEDLKPITQCLNTFSREIW